MPFIIAGEGGFGEFKQLNCTNLFLLNKLGRDIDNNHDEVIDHIKVEQDVENVEIWDGLKAHKTISKNL